MNPQLLLQNILNAKFAEIRARNAAFTFRAFSERLGVSHYTLVRFLMGEQQVSRTLAEKICERLLLDPQERADLLRGFPRRKSPSSLYPSEFTGRTPYSKLAANQYRAICEWQHYAILSLMKTKDFQSKAAWIADRLGLETEEAEAALNTLESHHLIKRDASGNWVRTSAQYRTTDDVRNASLQWAHQQNLALAAEALMRLPVELRDFTAMTIPLDPHLLPKAKTLIRQFQDDLAELLEAEPGTEVYKFCTQLIPLTQVRIREENGSCDSY